MNSLQYSDLDGATAIALVLSRAASQRAARGPYIKDISHLLFELRLKGFRFRDLGLRKIPGGYYSEDVETFVGQLLSMGYATQRSPIKLEENGAKLCQDMVKTEAADHPAEVERLERAVDELLSKQVTAA